MGCAFRIPQTSEEAHRKRVESLEELTRDEVYQTFEYSKSPRVTPFRSLDSFKTDVSVAMTSRPFKSLPVQYNETNESIDISTIPDLPANARNNPLHDDECGSRPKNGAIQHEHLTAEDVPAPLVTQTSSSRYRPREVDTPITTPHKSNELPSENNRQRTSLPADNGGAPPPTLHAPGKSPEDHSQFDEDTVRFLERFPNITCEASFKNLVYRRYDLKQRLAKKPRDIHCILKRAKNLFQVARIAMESTCLVDNSEYQCSWRQLAMLRNDIKKWTLQCEQAAKQKEGTISMKKRMRKRVDDDSLFEQVRFRNGSMFSVVSRTRGASAVSWAPDVMRKSTDEPDNNNQTLANNPSGMSWAPPTKGEPTPRFVPATGTVEEAFDLPFSNFENLQTEDTIPTKDDALAKMWSFDSRPQNQLDTRHINIEGSHLHLGGIREDGPMSPNHLGFTSRKQAINAGKSPSISAGAPELQVECFSLDGHGMIPMRMGGMRLRTEQEMARFPASTSQASPININNSVREIFEEKMKCPPKALRHAKNLFVRSQFALPDLQDEKHDPEYDEAWRMLSELRRLINYLQVELAMWKAETMQEDTCPWNFKKMRTKNVERVKSHWGHKNKRNNLSCYSVSNFDDMIPLGRTNTNFTINSDLKFELEEGRNLKGGLSFGGEACPDVSPYASRDDLTSFGKGNIVAPLQNDNGSLETEFSSAPSLGRPGSQGITALFETRPAFHAPLPSKDMVRVE